LRRRKTFQASFAQRIDRDDRHPALGSFAQRRQHARMVGAGVVADAEDAIAVIEILQRHGSLADADRFRQADTGGLMAHVRAIGKIVGAVFPHEQLIQKSGLVRGPARGVELRHVGIGQGAQCRADLRHRLFPGNRQIPVGGAVVDHWMGQPALVLKVEIPPVPEFADSMGGEEFRRGSFGRGLPRHRLGAVLAEFERRGVLGIRPGTTRTIESMGLIHGQEAVRFVDDGHLPANRLGDGLERSPTGCSALVVLNARDFLVGHEPIQSAEARA
jgi:hypothetical protein